MFYFWKCAGFFSLHSEFSSAYDYHTQVFNDFSKPTYRTYTHCNKFTVHVTIDDCQHAHVAQTVIILTGQMFADHVNAYEYV